MSRAQHRMACVVSAMLVLAGCGIPPPSAPLTIGIGPSPGFDHLCYAQETGSFDRAALAVRLVEYDSLTDARVAFGRGQIDGMAGTLVGLQEASLHTGRTSRAVPVMQASAGNDVLLARRDVVAVTDLVGRRVAVEPDSLNAVALERTLDDEGVRPGQLQLLHTSQSAMPAALLGGQVDAVFANVPMATRPRRRADLHALIEPGGPRADFIDLLAFGPAVLTTRAEESRRLVSPWDAIDGEVRRYGDEALALMAERGQLMLGEFKWSLAGLRGMSLAEQPACFAGGKPASVSATLAWVVARRHDVAPSRLVGCCLDDSWRPPANAADVYAGPWAG